ncbi:MAG: J domain-containing protein [Nitrospiraceae bacterium]|nr:J domain-containing protein [Nitrospiraceae bacterium]
MIALPDANIQDACKALFGPDTCVSPSFLLSLKPNTIKTAFRKKAKETHPDLFTAHDPAVQKRQAEMFRVVNDAYEIMRRYCERRDRMRVHPVRRTHDTPRKQRTADATRTFRVDEEGWLYRGIVPERRLEIGRYLYYRGRIPYHTLLRALAWQMKQRPTLGAIAKSWGWLSDDQVRTILGLRSYTSRFGQRALQLGFLSSYQARLLLSYQRTLQKKLGQYFVEHGHFTQTEMDDLVADLTRHNARFPLMSVAEWRRS